MTNLDTPLRASLELTNTCVCEDDEGNPFDCGGYHCWDNDVDFLENEIIKPFKEAKDPSLSDSVIFEGTGITWQRRSGYYVLEDDLTAESFIKVMGINGDYTLRISLSEDCKTLKVVRSSHDEPTGAPHTVSYLPKCKACGQGNTDDNSAWCSEDCRIDLMAESQIALSD